MRTHGFTLIEIIFVLVIVSIISLAGIRYADSMKAAERFKETLARMEMVRDHLVGDDRIVQCGQRIDFGYLGKHAVFPANLDLLTSVWVSANPYIYAHDGWTHRYTMNIAGTRYTVKSLGANNAESGSDAGFDTDMVLSLVKARYTANTVYVYCKDVRGTMLRGIVAGDSSTYTFHIYQVVFKENGAANQTMAFDEHGFWSLSNVTAGRCSVVVYPADGDAGKNCSTDRRPELLSSTMSSVRVYDVVYPKGGLTSAVYNKNVIEVRFPGAVQDLV